MKISRLSDFRRRVGRRKLASGKKAAVVFGGVALLMLSGVAVLQNTLAATDYKVMIGDENLYAESGVVVSTNGYASYNAADKVLTLDASSAGNPANIGSRLVIEVPDELTVNVATDNISITSDWNTSAIFVRSGKVSFVGEGKVRAAASGPYGACITASQLGSNSPELIFDVDMELSCQYYALNTTNTYVTFNGGEVDFLGPAYYSEDTWPSELIHWGGGKLVINGGTFTAKKNGSPVDIPLFDLTDNPYLTEVAGGQYNDINLVGEVGGNIYIKVGGEDLFSVAGDQRSNSDGTAIYYPQVHTLYLKDFDKNKISEYRSVEIDLANSAKMLNAEDIRVVFAGTNNLYGVLVNSGVKTVGGGLEMVTFSNVDDRTTYANKLSPVVDEDAVLNFNSDAGWYAPILDVESYVKIVFDGGKYKSVNSAATACLVYGAIDVTVNSGTFECETSKVIATPFFYLFSDVDTGKGGNLYIKGGDFISPFGKTSGLYNVGRFGSATVEGGTYNNESLVGETYTLSFNATTSDSVSNMPSSVSCTTTSTSCTVTIPSTIPTRSGYTFKGWANSSSATSANYQAGGTVTLTANKTVYAIWEANSSATSYIFDGITQPSAITGVANGTAKTAAALGLPSKVTVSLINAGDLTDYSTEQWDVNWNVAGSSYNPSSTAAQTFTVTGTVTLPSNVTNSQGLSTSTTISVSVNAAASKTYTLAFNTNGGTGTVANQSCTTTGSSCTATIPSTRPTRSGYTFKGWGSSSSTTSASYQPGNTVTLTANRTLYAVWEQNATPDPDPDPTPDPDPDPDSGADPDDDSSDGSDSDGSDNNDSNSNSNNSGSNGVAVPDTGANGHDGSNGAEAVWMIAGVAVVVAAGAIVLRRKHHTTVDFGKE